MNAEITNHRGNSTVPCFQHHQDRLRRLRSPDPFNENVSVNAQAFRLRTKGRASLIEQGLHPIECYSYSFQPLSRCAVHIVLILQNSGKFPNLDACQPSSTLKCFLGLKIRENKRRLFASSPARYRQNSSEILDGNPITSLLHSFVVDKQYPYRFVLESADTTQSLLFTWCPLQGLQKI